MFQKNSLISVCIVAVVCLFLMAAKPDGITKFTSIWIGDSTQTADVTPGENDAYIYGTLEVDGAARFDGGTTLPAGDISSDDIADITRVITLSLCSAWLEGVGPIGIDGTTAPGINTTALDGIYGIVYGSSAEVASLGWTFTIPPDYSTGLAFRTLVSTDTDTATASFSLDWELWRNRADTTFNASAYTQTAVGFSAGSTPSASNEMLTLTADATALAAITAGDIVTVKLINADARVSGTTEIKSLEARYTAVR